MDAGVLDCMLPWARVLEGRGERGAAEELYRRAFELGDGHSAWNLSLLLEEEGRDDDEAADWRRKAAEAGDDAAIGSLADESPPEEDPAD